MSHSHCALRNTCSMLAKGCSKGPGNKPELHEAFRAPQLHAANATPSARPSYYPWAPCSCGPYSCSPTLHARAPTDAARQEKLFLNTASGPAQSEHTGREMHSQSGWGRENQSVALIRPLTTPLPCLAASAARCASLRASQRLRTRAVQCSHAANMKSNVAATTSLPIPRSG